MPTNMEFAAWRSAADTIADLTFEQYRKHFIHETPQIRRFLSETRAEHFIISAPKGFGKTLLLIAKRLQLNEHSPELERGGEIVDRPGGNFRELSKARMYEYRSDFELWRRIWSYSIMVAAINKHSTRAVEAVGSGPSPQTQALDPWTQDILRARERFRSPTLVFTSLLDLDFTSRQRALNSLNRLNVLFAGVQSQVAFFIDNVDEYFAAALENLSLSSIAPNGHQHRSNQIWINAQLALVAVAFELRRINHHIRVYCTVRREAFLKLKDQPAEYSQIIGSTVEISYERSDLRVIFEKNVSLMGKDGLFSDPETDAEDAFFGPSAKSLRHRLVEKSEGAFDYVLRHTFYRPRDLMTICSKIALLPIDQRTPESIKETVDDQSTHLVDGIYTEMKPFFRLPDLDDLLPCVRRNALSLDHLEAASLEYIDRVESKLNIPTADWNEDYQHPFCILYQIGMLGWIQPSQRSEYRDVQRFVKPRDVEVGKPLGLPPTEEVYLIHPALDHMISARVGGEYFRRFHRTNIIGPDLPWSEPVTSLFVVKGDLCGFSHVMQTEFYRSVALRLHEWARAVCSDLDFVEVTAGDSITLIDRSPDKVLDCILQLQKRAESYREHPLTFRFGGSAGPIIFDRVERRVSSRWETLEVPLGQALRSSARLEPHAPKGKLIVDGAFFQTANGRTEKLHFEELGPDDVPTLFYSVEERVFSVQKSTTDPVQATRLYVVHSTD